MSPSPKRPSQARSRPKTRDCCAHDAAGPVHPDHSEFLPRLNRVQGQLSGIQKMIQDERYCVDILVQFRAVMAALRSIEVGVFEKHLQHCLADAFRSKDERQIAEKIAELTDLLSKRSSL
jgi:DNA-binding FrmR family transcriptional regulator